MARELMDLFISDYSKLVAIVEKTKPVDSYEEELLRKCLRLVYSGINRDKSKSKDVIEAAYMIYVNTDWPPDNFWRYNA